MQRRHDNLGSLQAYIVCRRSDWDFELMLMRRQSVPPLEPSTIVSLFKGAGILRRSNGLILILDLSISDSTSLQMTGLARFRVDHSASPKRPVWLLVQCGGLDVPVLIGRKTAAPQVESLPLIARSRSAMRGCAKRGRAQKAAEPPVTLTFEIHQPQLSVDSLCLQTHTATFDPRHSKTLGNRSRSSTRTSDHPLFHRLHNTRFSSRMRHKFLRAHSEFLSIVAWPSCAELVDHPCYAREGTVSPRISATPQHLISQDSSARRQGPAAGAGAKCGEYMASTWPLCG